MIAPLMIQTIVPTAVVLMKVCLAFQVRVADIAEYLLITNCSLENGELDLEKMKLINKQIETDTITEPWVSHYETMLIFLKEFEELAKQEGYIVPADQ
jgi:hypothetical protein